MTKIYQRVRIRKVRRSVRLRVAQPRFVRQYRIVQSQSNSRPIEQHVLDNQSEIDKAELTNKTQENESKPEQEEQSLASFTAEQNPYLQYLQQIPNMLFAIPDLLITEPQDIQSEKTLPQPTDTESEKPVEENSVQPPLPPNNVEDLAVRPASIKASEPKPEINRICADNDRVGIKSKWHSDGQKPLHNLFGDEQKRHSLLNQPARETIMPNLTFRAGTAIDGTRFALLTDQGDITDPFDNAYKISYRDRGLTENSYQLPTWEAAYTASSKPFEMIPESRELPQSVQDGFTTMVAALIKGVDVFFCDYNLAISDDHPMCNEIMDKYRNTDFVLFSCADIVGSDPSQQPYCVSYAAPRYDSKTNPAVQHRIYCKTEAFAFLQAVNAIVHQRTIDQYAGGNIREEHRDPLINASDATRELNQFIDVIGRLQGEVKALPGASS